MPIQSKYPALSYIALTLIILAAFTLAVLAIPSARTLAQGLLERVGGYGFSLGSPETIDASQVPGPIRIVQESGSVSIQITGEAVSTTKDPAEAGKQAGFSVLLPSYLPPGYTPLSDWFIISQGNGIVVTSDSHDPAKHILFINQWKVGEGDLKEFAREQIVDVTVRGRNGVWLPGTASSNDKRALVWEENGITYSLISDSLPLEEMVSIAESLE